MQHTAWETEASDLPQAAVKAQAWLRDQWDDDVVLVAPGRQDERSRGWVFPCNTRSFLTTGDWRHGMLAAAVVVPKQAEAPFLVHYTEPQSWLERWDAGAEPGRDIPAPPRPAQAEWLAASLQQVGGAILGATECPGWPEAMDVVRRMPVGAQALVWARRFDFQGRDTVGMITIAHRTTQQTELIDPGHGGQATPVTEAGRVHVIRYR